MSIGTIIFCLLMGSATAFLLNKIFADKIESKTQKVSLKIAAYILFMAVALLFALVGSVKPALDTFVTGRIDVIEITLNNNFPNMKIMEIKVNTNEFSRMSSELQEALQNIDTSGDTFFEKLVFDAFMARVTTYTNAADGGINTLALMGNEYGDVTIKSLLTNLKDIALEKLSPYLVILNVVLIIISFIVIGVYVGIAIFLQKGGASYNKSIVYGNNQ